MVGGGVTFPEEEWIWSSPKSSEGPLEGRMFEVVSSREGDSVGGGERETDTCG